MLQSYNRYSYVMNNPLSLTDPSGYFSLRRHLRNPFRDFNNHGDRVGAVILGAPFGRSGHNSVFNFLQGSGGYQVKSAVISVLSIFCGYGAAACNGGGQAGLAKAYGASDWDAFNAGGQAALSTGLFQWAGTVGGSGIEGANSYARYFAHAGAGCVSAVAGGGNCGQGAASAVFGKFATNAIDAQPGQFDAFQAAATVVAGGVGSVIGGGKFANGAMTAAFGYLYNQAMTRRVLSDINAKLETPEVKNAVNGAIADVAKATSDASGAIAAAATITGQPEVAIPSAVLSVGAKAIESAIRPDPAQAIYEGAVDVVGSRLGPRLGTVVTETFKAIGKLLSNVGGGATSLSDINAP